MSETSQSFACYLSKQQAKNQLFPEITSSRWQEENNRLLFSVTGTDNQGLNNAGNDHNCTLYLSSMLKIDIGSRWSGTEVHIIMNLEITLGT